METILFITDLHIGAQIAKVSGVFSQARRHGWRVIEIERERTTRPLSDFIESWKPVGCIYECSGRESPPSDVPKGIPTVFLDPAPTSSRRPRPRRLEVSSDATAIAELALDELEVAGCSSYIYVGWRSRTGWSVERGNAFRELLRARGRTCLLFDDPWTEELEMQRRLAELLPRLPHRIGILAANDYVAKQVSAALGLANLVCPRDCALVSVDNDDLICETYTPTISSIAINFEKAGRLATELLAEALANPALTAKHLAFGPSALHRRQSTRIVNTNDWRILRAVERIRRDACNGLRASDVIAETGLSRRLVEKRFLEATGKTILGEIGDVRFAHACQLLRDTSIPIGEVAFLCGWESDSYLKRVFKSRTGLSPRQWRHRELDDLA